ncbi:MAG: hypothetical protein Q8Q08_03235 [Candidatus Omnitrophota bacterium]|nr:hypothetical protein [Candidatus Omnitrophota bacterium]MDZ4241475.1 hypothetical protein [Candidatus Omnitrophota bacterium]
MKTTVLMMFLGLFLAGCASSGNVGNLSTYNVPVQEAAWVRNGNPLPFEDELWHPQDEADVLLDSEVQLLGEYQGAQFFAAKIDVRPFDRLYTKLDRNKFRIFLRKP